MNRAMFIIDNKGILRQITINDRPVGRSVNEARRLVKTIQHAEKLRESTPKNGFTEGKKKLNYMMIYIFIIIFK
jgi:alkyl hydroperoxide reductase subunit AhpC